MQKIIDEYLSNQHIFTGDIKMKVTAKVPQGSVHGPILWNLMYDEFLRIRMEEETALIGYADDLAMLASEVTKQDLVAY